MSRSKGTSVNEQIKGEKISARNSNRCFAIFIFILTCLFTIPAHAGPALDAYAQARMQCDADYRAKESEPMYRVVHPFAKSPARQLNDCVQDATMRLAPAMNEEYKDQQLAAYQANLRIENERRAAAEAAAVEQQARENALESARVGRERDLQTCLSSAENRRRDEAIRVQTGIQMITFGQQLLDHDEEVEKESGTMSLSIRHNAGEEIVAGRQLVKEAFSSYKALGGTELSPEYVQLVSDPCARYRERV